MNLASRETAFVALFNLVSGISGIKQCTRRLQHWADIPPEELPALYMQHTGETHNPSRGLPDKIVLEVSLWLYVRSEELAVGPILNPILDAIGQAFVPSITGENTLTLGGVVHHCWIEGQIQIFEGDLGDEAVAVVPLKILVS